MDITSQVKDLIKRRYPELADVEPTIAVLDNSAQVLTFRKELQAPDGVAIRRIVRVTIDTQGNIVKISEARG